MTRTADMLVSIITPTYNRAGLLPETIESVLNQDYAHIEYLVLDDGSSDNTQEVLKRYADRIRVERHANMGETLTVNKGFGMVSGEIVGVVNSDDPLLPGGVTEIVNALRAHPEAVAAYPDWAKIDEHGNTLQEERLTGYDARNMLLQLNWGLGPGAFFRRDLLNRIGPRNPNYTYCGDMEFWLRAALEGPLVHIPKVLATHRVHGGSASVSQRGRKMANEWIEVFHSALSSPQVPRDVSSLKHRLLRNVYLCAAEVYCGRDWLWAAWIQVRSIPHGIAASLHAVPARVSALLRHPNRPTVGLLYARSKTWLRSLVRLGALKVFALGVALLRLALRVPKRSDNTNGIASTRFAFCTRFLPPMWSGQAVVIGRLLAGLSPSYYCFATQPVYGNRHENDFTGALPGRYYDLPAERHLRLGRVSDFVRYLDLFWGIVQRGSAMARALKHDPVDTLIGCSGDQIDLPATFLAARILRCRYFMYFFDDYTEQWWADPAIQKVVRRIERVLALRADGLISPNEYMQRELLNRYQKRSFVVRNPTPRIRSQAQAAPFPYDDGEIKLVFTGAIYHLNYDIFRNVIAAIGRLDHPNVRLHLYTAQPADDLVRQGLTGKHVVIHSHLPPAEVLEAQCSADILLIPFSFQPAAAGIVRTSGTAKLADYLMSGRPVVAICHQNSFLAWYLTKFECGIAITSEGPAAIAESLQTIIRDESLRERLHRNAGSGPSWISTRPWRKQRCFTTSALRAGRSAPRKPRTAVRVRRLLPALCRRWRRTI